MKAEELRDAIFGVSLAILIVAVIGIVSTVGVKATVAHSVNAVERTVGDFNAYRDSLRIDLK